jgi:hypothetical protein
MFVNMAAPDPSSSGDSPSEFSTALLRQVFAAAQMKVRRLQQVLTETEGELNAAGEEARLLERILAIREGDDAASEEKPTATDARRRRTIGSRRSR